MQSMTQNARRLRGCAATALLLSWGAFAQSYPVKPVRIIEPHVAGTVADIAARVAAQAWSQAFGQNFIVDNRPGGEMIIGNEACARADADGYTLCFAESQAISLHPLIRPRLPYDPRRDFTPIVHLGFLSSAVVAHPSVSANSFAELLEQARAKPESIAWGSFGNSSLSNIYIEWLKGARGIRFYNVPYKTALQAAQAVMSGEAQIGLLVAGQVGAQLKAGKLKVLAVNGDARSARLPEVPSFKDLGIDLSIRAWFGVMAPAAVQRPLLQRLNSSLVKALEERDLREKFTSALGMELNPPALGSIEEFARFLQADRRTYEDVVKLVGLKDE